MKNIPSPYDQNYLPVQHTEQTSTTTPDVPDGKSPQISTGTSKDGGPPIPSKYSNQYPTLPNLDNYEVGGNEQQYPQPTYPGQKEYQRQGVPYGSTHQPSETTQLINQ